MSVKLSENFWSHEFECPCCGGVFSLKQGLLDKLEDFREFCGEGIRINRGGGTRCVSYHCAIYTNLKKEPRLPSRHTTGEGADISLVSGRPFTQRELDEARAIFGGVGHAESLAWMHVDIRDNQKWWSYQGE